MPETPPLSADRPDDNALATEQLRRLQQALERIAPDKRIAFALWALEGIEVETIAEMTRTSVSATRSRIYYAQKELKALAAADPYLSELVEDDDAG
jgi:RNA polymerase sigma factor (sigma-70 family)